MYFFKPVSSEIQLIQMRFNNYSKVRKLMLVAIFACIAAIFQAAGGLLPGIGFFISPLATAPVLLCSFNSPFHGLMSYFLTIMLLFIIEPTELIIFPFLTGLLGLGIGTAFSLFKRRISMIVSGAILLTLGIISLLYIFQFPVLGPLVSTSFSLITTGSISLFTLFYSWLWVEVALTIVRRLEKLME